MKLSKSTVDILSNFSTISNSIAFFAGNKQRIITPTKSLFAEAELDDSFPQEFAIYNLGQLLSVLSLYKDPDLTFGDKSLTVTESDGTGEFNIIYKYCAVKLIPNVIPIEKNITFPTPIEQFTLKSSDLSNIIKAVNVLGVEHVSIKAENGQLTFNTYIPALAEDSEQASSARFVVGQTTNEFQANIPVERLKFMTDDYTVKIAKNSLIRFEAVNHKIMYTLPADHDSKNFEK